MLAGGSVVGAPGKIAPGALRAFAGAGVGVVAGVGFATPALAAWVGSKISVPRPMIAPPAATVHWVRNSCIHKSIGVFTDLQVAPGRTGVTLCCWQNYEFIGARTPIGAYGNYARRSSFAA